jgi:hypothetical protein
MAKPSDQQEAEDVPSGSPGGSGVVARKVTMIHPGFRPLPEGQGRPFRFLGISLPAHPRDRRNLLFLGLSLLVALVIFALLEIKQQREALGDPPRSSVPSSGPR